jgi:peptidoglycan/xylan/chitin deacetylase (PgdA/CDA1 family)
MHTHDAVLGESNPIDAFREHLAYLAKHYPIVVPGEPLVKNKINLCITFDDAYYDFYHTVFPLLQTFQIPAVLAIPSGLIIEDTKLSSQSRLEIPYDDAMATNASRAGLYTWQEIREMLATNLVIPASHGMTHQAITMDNFEQEIILSKQLLEKKTGKDITTFVYPYGHIKRAVHRKVRENYSFAMRIGSASNRNWQNAHRVCYRINGDDFWLNKNKPFLNLETRCLLNLRWISNTIRFK